MKIYFFIAAIFSSTGLFSQIKAVKPLTAKTVAAPPSAKAIEAPKNNRAADLQKVVMNIELGNDGMNSDTIMEVSVFDQAHHVIASSGDHGVFLTPALATSGQNLTLPITLFAGETSDLVQGTFSRNGRFTDFSLGGGGMDLFFIGRNVLEVKRLSLDFYFNGDNGKSRTATWTNLTISQGHAPELKFDKSFNALQ